MPQADTHAYTGTLTMGLMSSFLLDPASSYNLAPAVTRVVNQRCPVSAKNVMFGALDADETDPQDNQEF